MSTTWLIILAIAVIAVVVSMVKLKTSDKKQKGNFTKRKLATANEQGMFWRLVSAFPEPEFVVLAQVSFGALLTAKGGASRYSFSQKIADFVLLNKSFDVIAIIELDDNSHKGREENDQNRDAMLTQAGYKVLRYAKTPDKIKLMSDIKSFI